jgi:tetratricopeptide (TPR) repeat protein
MTAKTRKQQIEEMLAESPDDPFLHYGLAMEWVSAGDDDAAVREFLRLIELDGSYVAAYLQAGQALARRERIDEARAMFQRGIDAARRTGNDHALGEMQGFLDGLN